ncbi:MAG TPA: DUF3450 domain-containing protein [Burkholderiales bacterium]
MAALTAETSRRARRLQRRRAILRLAGAALALTAATGAVPQATAQDEDESPAETYARLSVEVERAMRHNAHVERLLESQAAEIASLEAQLGALEGTAASIEPLVQRMYRELDAFVAADAPFLAAERTERLQRLEELLAQEGNLSEKVRRMLEAIQIELEYGRTLGTYTGVLEDGRPAEFVHVGRVGLYYRTMDGRETGYWDAASRTWVVDDEHSRAIREALAMAKEEVAPDLLVLPVPAPEAVR